jgi:hypothetical protein
MTEFSGDIERECMEAAEVLIDEYYAEKILNMSFEEETELSQLTDQLLDHPGPEALEIYVSWRRRHPV